MSAERLETVHSGIPVFQRDMRKDHPRSAQWMGTSRQSEGKCFGSSLMRGTDLSCAGTCNRSNLSIGTDRVQPSELYDLPLQAVRPTQGKKQMTMLLKMGMLMHPRRPIALSEHLRLTSRSVTHVCTSIMEAHTIHLLRISIACRALDGRKVWR